MQMPPPIQDWMFLPQGFSPSAPAGWGARLRQLLGYKRWIYLLLTAEDHQIGLAWVDLGYISKVFGHFSSQVPGVEPVSVEALCLGQRQPFRRSGDGWKLQAGGQGLRLEMRLEPRPEGGRGILNLSSRKLDLSASWDADPLSLLWADTGQPHHTHKSFAQPATWQIRLPERQLTAAGLLGADVSYGWPPRHTRWFWAFAQSPALGFNLVEGFTGEAECGLWQQGKLLPLSEASFGMPADIDGAGRDKSWEIKTHDRILDMRFEPVSRFRDQTQLGLVSSDFIQAYGRFRGRLELPDGGSEDIDLPGVAEFQDTKW
ncbi:MAG: DUF2804 family protein [Candidatus Sericytochromatia bacterium]